MTRITVTRSSDFLYLALSARVKVNSNEIGSLSRGDTAFTDVPAGRTTISVDTATASGSFSISINLEPNREYVFVVSPRSESYLPGALFGLLGHFADTAINEQSGLFKIAGQEVRGGMKAESSSSTSTTMSPSPSAGTTSSPSPSKVTSGNSRTPEERLTVLKKMLDDGLISREDWEAKKNEILKSM
jgi:hypothetical protein